MKKFYSLALGMLVTLGASAQITNTSTNETYDNFTTAFSAVADGQELLVSENCDADNRYLVNAKTVTIAGTSTDVTLTHTYNNSFFMGVQTNGNLTVKNITLSSAKTRNTFFEVSNGGNTFAFENVVFKGFKSADGAGTTLVDFKTNGSSQTFKLTNCTFEDNNFAYDLTLPQASRCNFVMSGNNKARLNMADGTQINVEGELTNTDPIIINYTGEGGKVLVKNCTDPSKFKLTANDMVLVAEDGNLVVKMPDPVYVTTVPETTSLNDTYYGGLVTAINAIVAYNSDAANAENKIETANIVLSKDQTISSRLTIQSNIAYNITPAEGTDITITCTASNISFLINNNANVTISDITLTSDDTNRNKQQIEVTSHAKLTLNNVTISNMRNDKGVMIQVTNGGTVAANNVAVENCTTATHFAFYGSSGSSFSGTTAYSFCIENNYNMSGEGWTPANAVDVYFSGTRDFNTLLFSDFTDIDKLSIQDSAFALEEKDGSIYVIDPVNAGIDEVGVDAENGVAEYYNLQGVRVENPTNGLFIKKQGSKVQKVILK